MQLTPTACRQPLPPFQEYILPVHRTPTSTKLSLCSVLYTPTFIAAPSPYLGTVVSIPLSGYGKKLHASNKPNLVKFHTYNILTFQTSHTLAVVMEYSSGKVSKIVHQKSQLVSRQLKYIDCTPSGKACYQIFQPSTTHHSLTRLSRSSTSYDIDID